MSLKDRNIPGLMICTLMNIGLTCFVLSNAKIDIVLQALLSFSLSNLILYGLFVLTFLLNYLLPANVKNTLVFHKIKYPLPGCRAFSELIYQDDRIDKKLLVKMLGKYPSAPDEQNLLWYKIYRMNGKDNVIVNSSHRSWLLLRDLTGISVIMTLLSVILNIFSSLISIDTSKVLLIAIFSTEYFIFMAMARNSGNRFVQNVIVEFIANNQAGVINAS